MREFVTHRLTIAAVISVLLLGEVFRSALSITGWAILPAATIVWALVVVWRERRIDRVLPIPLIAFLAWITLTPLWSPYAATAGLGVVIALGTVLVAFALTRVATLSALFALARSVLRVAIYGSLAFELVAAVLGRPIFKVGEAVTSETPREIAWSRAELFDPAARIQGLPGNANILAILTILFLLLTAVEIGTRRRLGWLIAFDLVVSGYVFVRTESATAILALAAAAIVGALVLIARRRTRASGLIVWGTGAVGLIAIVVALVNFDRFTALLGKSPDLTHRFDIWNATLARIIEQPIVGHGYVGFWPMWEPFFALHSIRNIPVSQAHNAWLDFALQAGFVGAVLFAVALVVVAVRTWKSAVFKPSSASLTAVMVLTVQIVQSITESRLLSEWGLAFVVIFAIEFSHRATRQSVRN
jgi:exopolysaccharide production protein ExoQ